MEVVRFSLFVVFVLCHFSFGSSSASIGNNSNASSHDEQSLMAFKSSIKFDPNKVLSTWNPNTNFCNWSGVTCTPHRRALTLDLGSLRLGGFISPFLGNLSFLERLNISNNTFQGPIPQELGHKLTNLINITMWGNQLTGPIPTSLGNCSKLERLDLSLNNLSGNVPLELGKLKSLRYLVLNHNRLKSTKDLLFLTALVNCSVLEKIDLDYNRLYGVLPLSIDLLSTKLSILSLADNHIGGNIPPQIGNLTMLTLINFTSNVFTGPIPPSLGMLQNLERLYLGQNNLNGSILSTIGNCTRLGLLSLSFNQLSGHIPESIGYLPQLRRLHLDHNQFSGSIPSIVESNLTMELLDLSYNNLTGNIPPEVAGLKNIQFSFNLSWNFLQGTLPSEIGAMVSTQGIDVSGNQLSGAIPGALASCIELEYLNLSHNAFVGQIPDTISRLLNLQSMDLSYNNFSGVIPNSLGKLPALNFVNFSFNSLSGEIPKAGLFVNLTAASFRGNPGLCGGWIPSLPPCPNTGKSPPSPNTGKSGGRLQFHFHLRFHKYFLYIAAPLFGLMVYCLYIWFVYKCFFPYQNLVPSLKPAHPRISCKELDNATNAFGMGHLLGVGSFGSVYKGVLDDGTLVAVKVLNLQNEAALKSFNMECEVLGKARHRNIIRAITSCSNLDFKGLVLEFMSNGSLEENLYCDSSQCDIGDVCKMNLQRVFQIALDIARGLAYLHHYCSIQVVHCDLKPSNVLLDFYMTAHIADFGNAQILLGNSMHYLSSANTLKGTLGYIAPESGIGARISTQIDVYSYGIVILEMITRKRPTNHMFVQGLSLRKWVMMAFHDKILEVVDKSLLQSNRATTYATGNSLVQLIRIALLCTNDSPKDRPTMAEVVELLESIEDTSEGSRLGSKFPSDPYQMVASSSRAANEALHSQSSSSWQTTS